jgi:hypothetical protein
MKENEDKGQSSCCEGSNCCSPEANPGSGRGNRWKMIIFSAVILLACAVTAYSLLGKQTIASNSSCCPPGSGMAEGAAKAGLDEVLAGASFAFVALPNAGEPVPAQISMALDSVAVGLAANEKSGLRILTISSEDPAYIMAINNFNVNEYPALLALGQGCNRILTKSEMNSSSMIKIFRTSMVAVSACSPGGI